MTPHEHVTSPTTGLLGPLERFPVAMMRMLSVLSRTRSILAPSSGSIAYIAVLPPVPISGRLGK